MITLRMVMHNYSLSASRKERSPMRSTFDRHSSFTDLTQRSEQAFRFGLRTGSASGQLDLTQ
jgi:hypothetical protein